MHQKLVPDLFLILLNNLKQPMHTGHSFKNKINFTFFQTQFLLMDKILKNKKDQELVNSRWSDNKTISEKVLH